MSAAQPVSYVIEEVEGLLNPNNKVSSLAFLGRLKRLLILRGSITLSQQSFCHREPGATVPYCELWV